jgi:hypothetical protein
VQGLQAVLAVVATSGRLAVDGHDRPIDIGGGRGGRPERLQPGGESGLEGLGAEGHQDASEDILAGDAVGQVERAGEEVRLGGGPNGDGGRAAGAGEDGQ